MRIGECRVEKGKIVYLDRGWIGQGYGFKDDVAYEYGGKQPCYVPELNDNGEYYTRSDILAECNWQRDIADRLFAELSWQSPSTLLDEWESEGEVSRCECGKLVFTGEVNECPYCGRSMEEQ